MSEPSGEAATAIEPIQVLMARVLADLPAIGKTRKNVQQGFLFRGIDDVLDALNPILGKHGVFYVPDVVERIAEERPTKSGGVLYTVHLHVRYRFYGPRGDYVEASGWGEGTDSGDKATNKAMTGAMKYVLFQTFAIATEEQSQNDSDGHQPEATQRERPWRAQIRAATANLSDDEREALKAWWADEGLPKVGELSQTQAAQVLGQIATITQGKEAPDTSAGGEDGPGEGGVGNTPSPEERQAGRAGVERARSML